MQYEKKKPVNFLLGISTKNNICLKSSDARFKNDKIAYPKTKIK